MLTAIQHCIWIDVNAKVIVAFDDSKRYDITVLPKWNRVVEKMNRGAVLKNNSTLGKYSWGYVRKKWRNLSVQAKLEKVNSLFNVYPYTEDIDTYKVEDYWATPPEFLKNSGDCEDYAIIKWNALLQLGIQEKAMRILVVVDTLRGIGHAVLLVQHGKEIYLLDNTTELVLPAKMYTHYAPKFTVDRYGVYLQ